MSEDQPASYWMKGVKPWRCCRLQVGGDLGERAWLLVVDSPLKGGSDSWSSLSTNIGGVESPKKVRISGQDRLDSTLVNFYRCVVDISFDAW